MRSRNGSAIRSARRAISWTSSTVRSDLFIEPVMHSSVNSAKAAPSAWAFLVHSSNRDRFASGSPISLCIATAATLTVSFVITDAPSRSAAADSIAAQPDWSTGCSRSHVFRV